MNINNIDLVSLLSPAKPAKTGISIIGCELALPFSPSKPFRVSMRALLPGQALLPRGPLFSGRGPGRARPGEMFQQSESSCAKAWVLAKVWDEQILPDLSLFCPAVALGGIALPARSG